MEHLQPRQAYEFLKRHADALLIDCRSGNCSQEAGEELERAGFTSVHHVAHGFEGELNEKHQRNLLAGWRFEGLPWEQC